MTMDRLEVMHLVRAHVDQKVVSDRSGLVGVGIGLRDPQAVIPSADEGYSIVVVTTPGQARTMSSLPSEVTVSRAELEAVAPVSTLRAALPDTVTADVRVEEYELKPLTPTGPAPAQPDDEEATRAGGFRAGSPVHNQNGHWVGTGGCVLNIDGKNAIVSNNHVFVTGPGTGVGTTIKDRAGQSVARVVSGRQNYDCAHATLLDQAAFNNDLPKIGAIRGMTGGINIGWHGRKFGATTGFTDFHVRLILPIQNIGWGTACQLVNMGGFNVPVIGQGDSGSVVVGDHNEVVGLMFAGDTVVGHSGANEIYSIGWCVDITQAFPGSSVP